MSKAHENQPDNLANTGTKEINVVLDVAKE